MRMDKKNKEPIKLAKLSPELEAQLPEQVQLIRKFYFSLSEEDRKKLEGGTNAPKKDWVTILQNEIEAESRQEKEGKSPKQWENGSSEISTEQGD